LASSLGVPEKRTLVIPQPITRYAEQPTWFVDALWAQYRPAGAFYVSDGGGLLAADGAGDESGDGRDGGAAAEGAGQLASGAEADPEPVHHPGFAHADL
jgi:hypothetical protein